MSRAGAPPRAVDFARALGGAGYLRRVASAGRVAVGEAEYLFRAGADAGVLLLNGAPPVVDPSDPALLGPLMDDERLAVYRRESPGAAFWPGDADGPAEQPRPRGGQRFVFGLPLRVCRACAELARARAAFDFDGDGRFLGARLLTVVTPPLFSVSGTVTRGKGFEAPIDALRTFRLRPFSEGWTVEVKDKGGNDYCAVVTPPYRGTNDLMLFGGDFKGAVAPAPRRFRCVAAQADQREAARALEKVLWSEKATWREVDAAAAEHEKIVLAAQRATLSLSLLQLGGSAPGGRPWIESTKFRFELLPPGAAGP